MIDKSIFGRGRVVLVGKLLSGHPVRIEFEDKGDVCKGFGKDGSNFAALTSWFRFVWPDGAVAPADWPARYRGEWRAATAAENPENFLYKSVNYFEEYSETEQHEAEKSGDVVTFRFYRDMARLTMCQVDVATLDVEPAKIG